MYIQYFIAFLGGVTQNGLVLDLMLTILDLSSEVNVMHPAFVEKLGFVMQTTNNGAQNYQCWRSENWWYYFWDLQNNSSGLFSN